MSTETCLHSQCWSFIQVALPIELSVLVVHIPSKSARAILVFLSMAGLKFAITRVFLNAIRGRNAGLNS